jgi:hypothetical protein
MVCECDTRLGERIGRTRSDMAVEAKKQKKPIVWSASNQKLGSSARAAESGLDPLRVVQVLRRREPVDGEAEHARGVDDSEDCTDTVELAKVSQASDDFGVGTLLVLARVSLLITTYMLTYCLAHKVGKDQDEPHAHQAQRDCKDRAVPFSDARESRHPTPPTQP